MEVRRKNGGSRTWTSYVIQSVQTWLWAAMEIWDVPPIEPTLMGTSVLASEFGAV